MLLLLLFLQSVVVFGQSNLLDIQINTTIGNYTIYLKGNVWFHSGDYGIHFDNKWQSTVDGSLVLLSSHTTKGMDSLGIYEETSLLWGTTVRGALWITTFTNYAPQSFIIFKQIFNVGFENTATSNSNDIISAFPSFKVESEPTLNYFTYHQTFANPDLGRWGPGTGYPYGAEGGPLFLFDSNLLSAVISPFDNFLVGIQTLSSQFNGQFACGLQGKISAVPQGFTHSTILSVSQGINTAHDDWGSILLKYYGKTPKSVDDDFTLKYLGYWTDNGAYYYYLTEPGKNYEQTMVDVYNYITSIHLPVKYYQYDSWWYYKGNTDGLLLWEPMTDVFPDGIKALQQQMGSTPIVLHNRWFENDTYYYTKMGYPFISEPKSGFAIPLSEDPYIYLMSKAKDWGLIVYEQDWLVDIFIHMEATQNNVSIAANMMKYLDNAANQVGLNVQLCMPLPGHILQSVKMRSVTQIRASDDYQRQIYNNNNWAIGYTSMLHNALGVYPFKDCFWSSNKTQTGCKGPTCVEPNAVLETLTATMSTGPVGPADKIGFLDIDNLMQSCRTDGVLLKPDIPLRTMDLVFKASFLSQTYRLYNLSHSYSQQVVNDASSGLRSVYWHYILAADTEISFTITPNDIGIDTNSEAKFFVFDYFEKPTKLMDFSNTSPLTIPALIPIAKDTVNFKYYIIVPSLGGNYTLIGETNKFTVAAFERFGQITKTSPQATVIEIFGGMTETVFIDMFYEPSRTVEHYSCLLSNGKALLTCLDNLNHCTCSSYDDSEI